MSVTTDKIADGAASFDRLTPADVQDPNEPLRKRPDGRSLASLVPEIAADHLGHVPDAFDLPGVEVFSAGRWNGNAYSAQDLAQMVEAFGPLLSEVHPWVTVNHREGEAVGFALGHVARLFTNSASVVDQQGQRLAPGDLLLADLVNIPRELALAVLRRNVQRPSIELLIDYESLSGKVWPRVLQAVSFEGAELEAVRNLRGLDLAGVDRLYRSHAATGPLRARAAARRTVFSLSQPSQGAQSMDLEDAAPAVKSVEDRLGAIEAQLLQIAPQLSKIAALVPVLEKIAEQGPKPDTSAASDGRPADTTVETVKAAETMAKEEEPKTMTAEELQKKKDDEARMAAAQVQQMRQQPEGEERRFAELERKIEAQVEQRFAARLTSAEAQAKAAQAAADFITKREKDKERTQEVGRFLESVSSPKRAIIPQRPEVQSEFRDVLEELHKMNGTTRRFSVGGKEVGLYEKVCSLIEMMPSQSRLFKQQTTTEVEPEGRRFRSRNDIDAEAQKLMRANGGLEYFAAVQQVRAQIGPEAFELAMADEGD